MRRMLFLMLLVPAFLVAASAARAGDPEDAKTRLRQAEARLEQLLREAESAEDPARGEALREEARAVRAKVERMRAEMGTGEEGRGGEGDDRARAEIRAHGEKVHRAATENLERLERMLVDLRRKSEALRAEGRIEDAEATARRAGEVERLLEANRQVIGLLQEAKARLENRRLEAAKEALKQAAKRLEEVRAQEKATGAPAAPGTPGAPPPVAETIEHLKIAAHHLRAAGAVKEAEAVETRAREILQAHERAKEEARAARERHEEARERGERGSRPPPEEAVARLAEEIRQIRAQLEEIKAAVADLRERLSR